MQGRKRHIVVTGASGFVGSRIVRRAIAEGWSVSALGRSERGLAERRRPDVSFIRWEIGDPIPPGADAVCHAAAFIPKNHADSAEAEACFRVNALGALKAYEAAAEAKSKLFVHLSSGQIYRRVGRPVIESDAIYPAERAVYYLASKVAAELFVEHARMKRQTPAAVLRLSSVYGPGMRGGGAMSNFVNAARSGAPLKVHGGGVYKVDFVHVDDVASAVIAAVDRSVSGAFNIGSGVATSMLDLARVIVDACGVGSSLVEVEPAPGGDPGFDALGIQKAKSAFGYQPRSLRDGIGDWLKESGSLS